MIKQWIYGLAISSLLALASSIGCASSGPGGGQGASGDCQSDNDCKGDRVCSDGECVQPGSNDCQGAGLSCEVNADCCNFLAGLGYCVNDGGGSQCHDSCLSGSDCSSGCCVPLDNGDAVCAAANECTVTCQDPGDFCSQNNDCCSYLEGQGYCVDDGDGSSCHDACSFDGDCLSGCCVPLDNGDAVCAAAQNCN